MITSFKDSLKNRIEEGGNLLTSISAHQERLLVKKKGLRSGSLAAESRWKSKWRRLESDDVFGGAQQQHHRHHRHHHHHYHHGRTVTEEGETQTAAISWFPDYSASLPSLWGAHMCRPYGGAPPLPFSPFVRAHLRFFEISAQSLFRLLKIVSRLSRIPSIYIYIYINFLGCLSSNTKQLVTIISVRGLEFLQRFATRPIINSRYVSRIGGKFTLESDGIKRHALGQSLPNPSVNITTSPPLSLSLSPPSIFDRC